jgi:hypothetical protein
MRALPFCVACLVLAGCSTPKHPEAPMSRTDDRAQQVRDVITSLVHELDGKHWDALAPLFTDPVETDYRSLFGGDVTRQPASALVAGWQGVLAPLDTTQHVLGPIAVTLAPDGDRAAAQCHVRGHHVKAGLPGGDEWMVAGHYLFELARTPGGWKIAKLTLQTYYQTGNRALLQEAAAPR